MGGKLPMRDLPDSTQVKIEQDQNENLSPDTASEASQMDSLDLMSLSQTFRILPAPTDEDDLETTALKIEDLAEVVKQGNSLALWTGLKLAPETPHNLETMAKERMTEGERQIFEAWKETTANRKTCTGTGTHKAYDKDNQKAFHLPKFNWDENVAPVPQGAQSLKKFTQRAAAMDIVFGHQGTTPEHASWLTFNMVFMLPLVKAVTKITNIERHFKENSNRHMQSLGDMEAAEVQTVRRIVAAAERNRTRELERIRRLVMSINESVAIIKTRAGRLERQ